MDRSLSSVLKRAEQVLAAHSRPTYSAAQLAARKWTLWEYFQQFWSQIEPATPLLSNWHMEAVCDHLQALLEGKLKHQNLAISVPPGTAKSTIVSVAAPTWWWINHPEWRAVFASGNPVVSSRDSLKRRAVLDSPWYKQTFGIPWTFAEDSNQKLLYENSKGGFHQATTTGSRVTGSRPHAIFVDDPLDAADAYSKAERDGNLNWWDAAFANRLADPVHGTRCIIMQRLHPEDLIGHVLATEGEHWEVVTIPQEWEESRRFTSSLGWTDPRTTDGELIFPERFPAHVVKQEKARLGSSGYAGQHQQRPTVLGGELFKADWIKRLSPEEMPPKYSQVIVSLDTAFSEKSTADFSVAVVLGQFSRGVVVLDVVRGRWAYPQLRAIAAQLAATWAPSAMLIENKASGQSLIQSLMQETALPVRAVDVDRDKVSRAHAVTPSFEAGRVHVPAKAPWLGPFFEELFAFPKAPHDDQVDALVQGVEFLLAGPGTGLFAYYATLTKHEEEERAKPKEDDLFHKHEVIYLCGAKPPGSPQPKSLFDRIKEEGAQAQEI